MNTNFGCKHCRNYVTVSNQNKLYKTSWILPYSSLRVWHDVLTYRESFKCFSGHILFSNMFWKAVKPIEVFVQNWKIIMFSKRYFEMIHEMIYQLNLITCLLALDKIPIVDELWNNIIKSCWIHIFLVWNYKEINSRSVKQIARW